MDEGEVTGLAVNTLYQLLWTLPRWDVLVSKHMARHETPVWSAAALLLAFGALFHVHRSVNEEHSYVGNFSSFLCCGTACLQVRINLYYVYIFWQAVLHALWDNPARP